MPDIYIDDLRKFYKKEMRDKGLKGAVKSIVKRKYEKIKAIDGISLSISKGEMVGLMGPNGAGKTTLMKLLSGVLYPDAGIVKVGKYIPTERNPEFLRSITFFAGQRGFLSATIWDLPPMDGYELIREIYGISKEDFHERLNFFVEMLSVEKLIQTPLRKLSLGERTKIELIGALLHFPKFVFLDEPTIGLDVVSQKILWDFFKEYNQRLGATLIISSHYIRDMEELGERIIILNKGKILYDGKKDKISSQIVNKKYIKIKFTTLPEKFPFKNVKKDRNIISFEIEKDEVNRTIDRINSIDGIIDIEITEPPLEDVIRKLFSKI